MRLIGQGIKSDVEDTKAVVEEIRAGFQDSNLTILDLSTKSAAGFAAQESWRQGQDTFQTCEKYSLRVLLGYSKTGFKLTY